MKKVMPPTVLAATLVAMIAVHFTFPLKDLIPSPYNYSGIALIVFGVVGNIWADKLFRKHRTTVKPNLKPTSLICTGPYAMCRHPMYLGMTAITAGVALLLGSLSPMPFALAFFLIVARCYIPLEERNMAEEFGEGWAAYKKKVRMWL